MKKFLVFVALAMVFILLTSGLAIGRKAAEDEPAESSDVTTATTVATTEAPGIQEGLFYTVDGTAYTKAELSSLTENTFVYFIDGDRTYFAMAVVGQSNGMQNLEFVYDADSFPEYSVHFCYGLLRDTGGVTYVSNFNLISVPLECYLNDGYMDKSNVYVVAVFLELSFCEDPTSVLTKFVDNEDFCYHDPYLCDPETPEGPSADVTTEATIEITTAPPQVDVPWSEEPGAE